MCGYYYPSSVSTFYNDNSYNGIIFLSDFNGKIIWAY